MSLTNITSVKAWMGETTSNKDALIASLILSCSQEIISYLNRNIESEFYEDIVSGNGKNTLTMKNWPITTVTAVQIGQFSYNEIQKSDFTSTGVKVKGRQLIAQGFKFEKGEDNIFIGYVAGYDEVPADIQQACNELINHRMKNERGDRQGVSSKSLAGETISFSHRSWPESVKTVLNNYVDRIPV